MIQSKVFSITAEFTDSPNRKYIKNYTRSLKIWSIYKSVDVT